MIKDKSGFASIKNNIMSLAKDLADQNGPIKVTRQISELVTIDNNI